MWSPTWELNLSPNADLVLAVYCTCKTQSALCLLPVACGPWLDSKMLAATALTQDGYVVTAPTCKGDVFCQLA